MTRWLRIAGLIVLGAARPANGQAPAPHGEAGRPYVAYYSPHQYGAPNQNFAVAQDDRGVVYVANRSGVLEFDGVAWRLIPSPDERTVWSVVIGPDGRILAAGDGFIGRIVREADGTPHLERLGETLPAGEPPVGEIRRAVLVDSAVYFSSDQRLYRWTEVDGLAPWGAPGRFGRVFSVRDTLYIVDEDRGLMRSTGTALRPVAGGASFAGRRVFAVLPHGDAGLVVGVLGEGLFAAAGTRFVPFPTGADALLRSVEPASAITLIDGTIAIATSGGVLLIDQRGALTGRIDRASGLRNDLVEHIFVDRQQGMWLALQNGLARVEMPSTLTRFDDIDLQGLEAIVRHRGRLYVSARVGLLVLEPSTQPGSPPAFRAVDGVTTECYGLLSTPQGLLAGCEDGVFSVREGRATRIRASRASVTFARSRLDTTVVYVGEADGLARLRLAGGAWRDAGSIPGPQGFVRHLAEEADGAVWIATRLYGLQRIRWGADPARPAVETFDARNGLPGGRLRVFPFDGRLLFATPEGLRRLETGDRFVPDTTFGLALARGERIVSRFTEGPGGEAWIVTDTGIGLARPRQAGGYLWDERPFQRMPETDTYAVYPEPDGVVWAGGSDDLVRYDGRLPRPAEPGFDTLLRGVTVTATDSLLRLDGAARARLPYAWNAVRFQYAAPRYDDVSENRFQVRLEGYDAGWSAWEPESRRTYDRLPEGAYVFHVRARDLYGVVGGEAVYAFEVRPPWWRTPWAYLAYLLAATGLLAVADRFQHRRVVQAERQKARLREAELKTRFAEEQAAALQDLNALRSRFFTGISHEFRTPLTLIMGPLEDLLERSGDHLPERTHADVSMALRNVRRLHLLTNQLLDVALLEAGRLPLHHRSLDLGGFLREVAAPFFGLALRREYAFAVEIPETPLRVSFDPDQMEKVFVNLLANAFKFTPTGGTIRLTLRQEAQTAVATLYNSGPAIPPEEQGHLFERFYRSDAAEAGGQTGSGIGLSLVKEITELHGGAVAVTSEASVGTTFTVRLPLSHEAAAEMPESSPPPVRTGAFARSLEEHEAALAAATRRDADPGDADAHADDVPTILVVEDNPEIRGLIRRRLQTRFRIIEASDGQEGLAAARELLPDLILSDILMPVMNGYALCRALKRDPELEFIPIVLLTALSSVEDRIEGRTEGADAYLNKPFDERELTAAIESLLDRQRRLKLRLAAERLLPSTADPAPERLSEDESLARRIRAAAEEGLSDEDFSVDAMATAVGMSRVTLYRHTVRLMHQSPSALLRTLRLERAGDLLQSHVGTVSEVGYAVGFKSLSHFSQAFREHFGHTPSEHAAAASGAAASGAAPDAGQAG